jgi:hypothetical protein
VSNGEMQTSSKAWTDSSCVEAVSGPRCIVSCKSLCLCFPEQAQIAL